MRPLIECLNRFEVLTLDEAEPAANPFFEAILVIMLFKENLEYDL